MIEHASNFMTPDGDGNGGGGTKARQSCRFNL